MKVVPHHFRILFSDLAQRALDAAFVTEFDLAGRFVTNAVKGRRYWYFDRSEPGGKKQRTYVGPCDDPDITQRVERFRDMKDDIRERRKIVRVLIGEAGFQAPDRRAADIVEALANAGFFRMRGVLVGTMAFQTYGPMLGVIIPDTAMMTSDIDFAKFHSISVANDDQMPTMIDTLQEVDKTFRPVPHLSGADRPARFVTGDGFKVEFLTPNMSSDEFADHPALMPSLGGAATQPLRFLDFLIHDPQKTILLHRAGIPVNVPAPERFGIHKLIVSMRRRGDPGSVLKSRKDLDQAMAIMTAMINARMNDDLADAFCEAMDRGPSWKQLLLSAMDRIPDHDRDMLVTGLRSGMRSLSIDPDRYLPSPGSSQGSIPR